MVWSNLANQGIFSPCTKALAGVGGLETGRLMTILAGEGLCVMGFATGDGGGRGRHINMSELRLEDLYASPDYPSN
jgi:hypothetical protein